MAAQMDEESRLLNREAEVVAEVEEAEAMGQFGRGMWRYAAIALAATAIGSFGVTYSRQFQSASSASSSVSTRLQLAKEGKVKYTSLSTSEHADLFDEFKKTFGKDYDSKEEKERYSTFLTNLEKVDTRNEKERKAGGTAVHGITQFADISPGEFKKYYLGYVAPSAEAKAAVQPAKVEKYTGTAKSVNWANVYTTSINNQGYCGSCWAFSAVQQIESDAIRAGLLTTKDKLSSQQVVSCDSTTYGVPAMMENWGCQGGNTETAYMYIAYNGGVSSSDAYPYTSFYGTTGDCDKTKSTYAMSVASYHAVIGEESMKDYVMSTGPLSICVDASDWSTYQGGIVSVCGTEVNHCVQVVGIDTTDGYWIVRNSWGTTWGEQGYIYLKTDQNTCVIDNDPTYATVTASKAATAKSSTKKSSKKSSK